MEPDSGAVQLWLEKVWTGKVEEPQFTSVHIYCERHRRNKRQPVSLKQRVRSSRRLEPGHRFEFYFVGNGEPLKNIKRLMG